jgi:hypothetical protein
MAAKAPVVRLCLRSTLDGKASLDARKLSFGTRSLGHRAGFVSILPLRGQPAAKFLLFILRRRQLVRQIAVLVFRG